MELVYRHELKKTNRGWSGYDRALGGFFLVAKESWETIEATKGDCFDASVIRTITDRKGNKVNIVRLTPHVHKFEPHNQYHKCVCGYWGSHIAYCPNTHCEVCGAEVAPSHRYEKIREWWEWEGKELKKCIEEECVGCGTHRTIVIDKYYNPFSRAFATYEDLREALLEARNYVINNRPSLPSPPPKPQPEWMWVEKEEDIEDLTYFNATHTLGPHLVIGEEVVEVEDYEEQLYPSLNPEGAFSRRAKFYRLKRWIRTLTPAAEAALEKWKRAVEGWGEALPEEVRVGLAALVVEGEEGVEAGSDLWVKLVGEACSRLTPFAFLGFFQPEPAPKL
jgi:hypothetical protein